MQLKTKVILIDTTEHIQRMETTIQQIRITVTNVENGTNLNLD